MGSSFYSDSGLTSTEQDSIESAIAAAETAQSGAETAKAAAETAEANAETAEANAEASKDLAAVHASTASVAAQQAGSHVSLSLNHANNASASAASASSSATSASTDAATATTQAQTATTQAQAAAASATSASSSLSQIGTSVTDSANSAAAALVSQNAAAASATSASTDAATATTQAGNSSSSATASSNSAAAALVSQNAAAASATSASTDAATATTKAGDSATSAAASLASQNAAASSASAASTSATSAASSLSSFQNQYLGASSTAPTQDPDGSSLDLGDLFFDTTANVMKVYSSSGWVNASSSVNGTSERQTYTATAGQQTFAVTYDSGFVDVWMNGSKLLAGTDFTATSGTDIVLASGAAAGDIIDIIAFGTFVFTSNDHYTKTASDARYEPIDTAYTKAESDARYVELSGDTITGDLTVNGNLNVAGTTVTIDSANAQTVDLGDNDKIRLGDGDDLQIYHDGSHSYIDEQGTGSLQIKATNLNIKSAANETYIACVADGQVELNYDNSTKLATTSSGVDVEGNLVAKGYLASEATNSTNKWLAYTYTDNTFRLNYNGAGADEVTVDNGGRVGIGVTPFASNGYNLQIGGTSQSFISIHNTTTGNTVNDGFSLGNDAGNVYLTNRENTPMIFSTNNTERLKIDASGAVDIGQTGGGAKLSIAGGVGTQNGTAAAPTHTFYGDNDTGMYRASADTLGFSCSGNERMRISGAGVVVNEQGFTGTDFRVEANGNGHAFAVDSAGYGTIKMGGSSVFSYGQTSGSGTFGYAIDNGSSYGSLMLSNNADRGWSLCYANKFAYSSGDDRRLFALNINGNAVGNIQTNSAGTAIEFNATSDRRMKENISDLTNGIETVKQLRPRAFEWITDEDTVFPANGFIADEADGVIPEWVTGEANAVDEDNNPIYQTMDYSKAVPVLTAALQEAIAKIETLETKVAALEAN